MVETNAVTHKKSFLIILATALVVGVLVSLVAASNGLFGGNLFRPAKTDMQMLKEGLSPTPTPNPVTDMQMSKDPKGMQMLKEGLSPVPTPNPVTDMQMLKNSQDMQMLKQTQGMQMTTR